MYRVRVESALRVGNGGDLGRGSSENKEKIVKNRIRKSCLFARKKVLLFCFVCFVL